MRRFSMWVVLASVFGAGCAPPPGPDVDAAYDELSGAAEAYLEALDNRDAVALAGFYAPDARIFAPDRPLISQSGVQAFLEEMFATPGFTLNVIDSPVHMSMSADLGYSTAFIEVRMTGPDGTPIAWKGPDVHIWKRQPAGRWWIILDIWNSDGTTPGDAGGF